MMLEGIQVRCGCRVLSWLGLKSGHFWEGKTYPNKVIPLRETLPGRCGV
jgi:hypothetical protein